MQSTSIQLTKVYNPFNHLDKDITEMPFVGKTVSDLLDKLDPLPVVRDNPDHCGFRVSVNGVLIPFEVMHETRLCDGDSVVMMPVLHGGGGGVSTKTILRFVIAAIATIVAIVAGGYGCTFTPYIWAWAAGSMISAIGGVIVELEAPKKQLGIKHEQRLDKSFLLG